MIDPCSPLLLDIETPALVVDRAAMDSNIAAMAKRAAAGGIALRPHAKTHKCIEIAKFQLEAGAIGIACATVGEAASLARAKIDDVLITSPLADPAQLKHLSELAGTVRLSIVVDHPQQVSFLSTALKDHDRPIDVLIDVDVGQGRTGVVSNDQAIAVARSIAASGKLRLNGVQGFAGHAQHIQDFHEREGAATSAGNKLRNVATALIDAGYTIATITGSGTGTSEADFVNGPYTELQVGSYIFMDADYGSIKDAAGAELSYKHSLFVLASVISSNRPGHVTVNAGTKALAVNGPLPKRIIGLPQGSKYHFAGDEHGVIELPASAPSIPVGSRILIEATHCDPTVNLHSAMHTVRASDIEKWEIIGRYGS